MATRRTRQTRRQTQPKYQQLAESLAGEIATGRLRAGDRLPSQNVLMQREGLALSTVRQAISELSRRGLVKPVRGSGVHVLPAENFARVNSQQKTISRIGMAIIDHEPQSKCYIFAANGVSKAIGSTDCGILVRHCVDPCEEADNLLADLTQTCDGVILMGMVDMRHVDRVQKAGIPVILAGHAADEETENAVSHVGWDLASSGHLAIQAMHVAGHRRFAMVTNHLLTTYQTGILAHLQAAAQSIGGKCILANTEGENYDCIEKVINKDDVTGLIVLGPPMIGNVLKQLSKLKRLVPRHVSVLCAEDEEFPSADNGVRLSRLVFSHEALGHAATKLLLEQPGSIVTRLLTPRLQLGNSIGQPRKAATRRSS